MSLRLFALVVGSHLDNCCSQSKKSCFAWGKTKMNLLFVHTHTCKHTIKYIHSIFMRISLFQVHLVAALLFSSAADVRNIISVFTWQSKCLHTKFYCFLFYVLLRKISLVQISKADTVNYFVLLKNLLWQVFFFVLV